VAPIAVEYCPAKQLVHAAFPAAILYLPATHWVHDPPSGPVEPALHAQSVIVLLPAGESALVGHETQPELAAAPCVHRFRYWPAKHGEHPVQMNLTCTLAYRDLPLQSFHVK